VLEEAKAQTGISSVHSNLSGNIPKDYVPLTTAKPKIFGADCNIK